MKLLQILFSISATFFGTSVCEKIFFEKCNHKGFTCTEFSALGASHEFTYQCNEEHGQDVTILLWKFINPSLKTAVTIKNCQTVRLGFGSDTSNDHIQLLRIQNVQNLHFIPATLTQNPSTIIFESITNIKTIPTNTFSKKLDSLVFQNMNIETIESEAFDNFTNMKYFRWENVSVRKIKTRGIKIEGNVQILNSEIEVLETFGFQVFGKKLFVSGSTFKEIPPSGLNGDLDIFEFSFNSVQLIQAGGFSIKALDVDITANNFDELKAGAFLKMKAKRWYTFRQNFIKHVQAGSLRPVYTNYESFVNNSFHCTCEGLAWLERGYNYLGFRRMLFDEKNNNTCAFDSCTLPLRSIRELILPNGKCKEISMAEMCSLYKFEDAVEENMAVNLGQIVNVKVVLLIVFVIVNYIII